MRSTVFPVNPILGGAITLIFFGGCISIKSRVIRANNPRCASAIGSFELRDQEVVVHGNGPRTLIDSAGGETDTLVVRPTQSFRVESFNCVEKWTLKKAALDRAVFDVRGHYYGCTDLFAICFGIPSGMSYKTITVLPGDAVEADTVEADK